MAILMVDLMRANDAPPSQYERLGLPAEGPVTDAHLLVRSQRDQAARAAEPLPRAEDYPQGRLSLRTPIQALVSDPFGIEVLRTHLPGVADSEMLQMVGATPLIDVAAMAGAMIPTDALRRIAEDLAKL